MYNSIFISVLVKIWQWIVVAYEKSLLKKVIGFFTKVVKQLSSGSAVVNFIMTENKLIEGSMVYRFYGWMIDLYNRAMISLNRLMIGYKKGSRASIRAKSSYRTEVQVLETHMAFLGTFVLGLILSDIYVGGNIRKLHIIMLVPLILIFLIIFNADICIKFLKESNIYKWVVSLLSAEEGSDEWW